MKPRISWLASGALGVIIVMILIFIAGPAALLDSFKRLTPQGLVLAVTLTVAFFLVRAVRWGLLLKPQGAAKYQTLLAATGFGYFVNLLIPVRIGEIARALVVSGRHSMTPGGVLGSVIVERVLDLSYLVGLLALSLIILPVGSLQDPIETLVRVSSLISLLGVSAIIAVITLREKTLRFIQPILKRIFPPSLSERIFSFIDSLAKGSTFPSGLTENVKINFMSLLIVFLGVQSVAVIVHSMDLGLSYASIFVGTIIVTLSAIVPAPPGNLGTFEVIWTATFVALGLSQSEAIASGIVVHLLSLFFLLVIGAFSITWLGVRLSDYLRIAISRKKL